MSDWKAKRESGAPKSVANSGIFSPVTPKVYQQEKDASDATIAADKTSKAVQQSFDLCERLPKHPVFKTADGEVTVKDGVIDAMGESAAQLLNIELLTPELTSSPGLGMSGSSSGSDQDS